MLLLYRGLIGFVLEYGSVCYAGMAKTIIFFFLMDDQKLGPRAIQDTHVIA
jgi:hypothetical protein